MRYKIFGERTGLKVSELALGTGMFGQTWGYGATPEEAKRIIEGFADAGGNFIDTADNYQHGVSETTIGDVIASNRDDFVIASKFTRGASDHLALAHLGNNRKNMVQSVEASLKRLKTDRIDLYFAHMDDFVTPMEEIARGLDDLVRAGKIICSGLSYFPAWRVATGDNANKDAVVAAVAAVGEEAGAKPGQVAVAWVKAKGVLPVIGTRTWEQFE